MTKPRTKRTPKTSRSKTAGCYTFFCEFDEQDVCFSSDNLNEGLADAWKELVPSFTLRLSFVPRVGDQIQITVDESLFVADVIQVRIGVSMKDGVAAMRYYDQSELALRLESYV